MKFKQYLNEVKGSYLDNKKLPKEGENVYALVGFNRKIVKGKIKKVSNIDQKGLANTYLDLDVNGKNYHLDISCIYDHKPKKVKTKDEYGDVIIWEEIPTGGRQHTKGALKSFGKRLEKDRKRYMSIMNDPNSDFNKHVNALKKNVPEWVKIEGVGVYRVPRSKIAALPVNDKKSSPQWSVFDINTRKELTTLKKKEVFSYLSRYAVDVEGMK